MDALLRYLLYHIAYKVLFIELILILLCICTIILVKFYNQWSANRRKQIQNELTLLFEAAIFNKYPVRDITLPSHLNQFRNLIEVMEEFDQRFSDPRWHEVKEHVISTYLLQRAERYAASSYWYKRQLAARCYLLCPQKAREQILAKLLQDKRYLVRIPIAVCITKTPYRQLFEEVIKQMSREPELSQFPYRDALIQADQEKFTWIEALLASEPDPAITAICLDILATRYSSNLFSIVSRYVNSLHRNCRLKAIEALGNIPSSESIRLLIVHLEDSDFKIRESSINGLEKLYVIQAAPKIGTLLNDPVWSVRLQAAKTLKNFGKEGMVILDAQKPDQPKAYEIAQHVLALP
ncbi:HEAT repeat domain-containing protein [Candidatus Protochlamydia phocaeensis]|uniref:HEAT repeat domain-containing protein n=1 Tax=Candidatus Protochlamydia phocaeensis TaxID=1414722 RepID=UPI000838F3BB|nr:HEAT repeat domain-containing protein [Candidatus Protochlamydia phocaeensis]